jgi:hypothetical protein
MICEQVKGDTVTQRSSKYLNGRSLAHADRVGEIRMGTSLFRINFHEVEVSPYAVNKIAQTAWIYYMISQYPL